MTIAEALSETTKKLEAITDSPKAEATLLLEGIAGLSRSELLLNRQHALSGAQTRQLHSWLERRLSGEPVQYITGTASFYGLELSVTPDVLIPRPETERLVELALDELRSRAPARLLDLGTGSGALALALKAERPEAVVMATDSSVAALELARVNAATYGLTVQLIHSDLFAASEARTFLKEADLLVSNPPYLPVSDKTRLSREVQREPDAALYSGADGLKLFRRLEAEAFLLLRPGAVCLLELDPRNVCQAAESARRWKHAEIFSDLVGRERFLKLVR